MFHLRFKSGQLVTRWAIGLLILVLIGFAVYPTSVQGGTPYVIQHESKPGGVTSGHGNDIGARQLDSQLDAARREVQQREFDRGQAYLPSGHYQAPTRQQNIQRAESALDNAQSHLKSIGSQMYMNKRVQESTERDRKLELQRLQKAH